MFVPQKTKQKKKQLHLRGFHLTPESVESSRQFVDGFSVDKVLFLFVSSFQTNILLSGKLLIRFLF